MQFSSLGKTFNRQQLFPVRFEREKRAGAHGLAVEKHRAGAADLYIARSLGSGKTEAITKTIDEQLMGFDFDLALLAVKTEPDRYQEITHERHPACTILRVPGSPGFLQSASYTLRSPRSEEHTSE